MYSGKWKSLASNIYLVSQCYFYLTGCLCNISCFICPLPTGAPLQFMVSKFLFKSNTDQWQCCLLNSSAFHVWKLNHNKGHWSRDNPLFLLMWHTAMAHISCRDIAHSETEWVVSDKQWKGSLLNPTIHRHFYALAHKDAYTCCWYSGQHWLRAWALKVTA